MRKNIVIVGYDYALSRRVAVSLAELFDMRFFDMYDMFVFDNLPNTLTDVIKLNGKEYVDKKMKGIFKSEFEFSNVIFVVDTKIVSVCKDMYEEIKKNNIVIFLRRDFKLEFYQREHFVFKTEEERDYFTLKIDELFEADQDIAHNLADMVLEVDQLTYRQVKDFVLEDIKGLLKKK